MIDERFVFLGALLSILGSARYAVATVRGQTKPNRVTWFLWASAPIIGFVAQLDDGVGLPAVLTLSIGLGPSIVVVASFFRGAGYWRITPFDLGCGAVSVAALAVWLLADRPDVAVLFAIAADIAAGIPTVLKAWAHPATENPVVFLLSGTNGLITSLTIRDWRPATFGFPLYIVIFGYGLGLMILLRGRRSRSGHHAETDVAGEQGSQQG